MQPSVCGQVQPDSNHHPHKHRENSQVHTNAALPTSPTLTPALPRGPRKHMEGVVVARVVAAVVMAVVVDVAAAGIQEFRNSRIQECGS